MDFFYTNIIGNEEEINFQRISMNSSSEIDHFFRKVILKSRRGGERRHAASGKTRRVSIADPWEGITAR